MKWNRRLRGLTMFVFNFSQESLEQSARNFLFPWQFPSLNTTFSKPTTKKQCLLQCFHCLSCFSAAVAKENLLKTLAIVSLANFQRSQMLRHPRLVFDWLSVSFFDYWPIRMSGLLLCCTSSALNYLKTAFILTNQNWVIFSCISLAQLSIQKVIFCLFKATRMIHV